MQLSSRVRCELVNSSNRPRVPPLLLMRIFDFIFVSTLRVQAGKALARLWECTMQPSQFVYIRYMRGSWKFCQRGSNFDKVFFLFLVDKGKEDQKCHYVRAIIGLSAKCHLNGVSMAIR